MCRHVPPTTGNTVILGLSTATIPTNPKAWLTTLVSIASFLVGAFLTFRATMYLYPATPTNKRGALSNRLYLTALCLIQSLLLLLSAGLATPSSLVPHHAGGVAHPATSESILRDPKIVALLPPLALQSGVQIAVSRLLGYNELPVNVLTSTYCDLMGDPKLFIFGYEDLRGRGNQKRNRRALAVVLLLVGAIAAAWILRSSAGLMGVLWVAGAIKFAVAAAAFVFLLPADADGVAA